MAYYKINRNTVHRALSADDFRKAPPYTLLQEICEETVLRDPDSQHSLRFYLILSPLLPRSIRRVINIPTTGKKDVGDNPSDAEQPSSSVPPNFRL